MFKYIYIFQYKAFENSPRCQNSTYYVGLSKELPTISTVFYIFIWEQFTERESKQKESKKKYSRTSDAS